jgi:hypothetical protein
MGLKTGSKLVAQYQYLTKQRVPASYAALILALLTTAY